jgi:membrane-associated protease RseP (regulator of RpoE activity)
VGFAGWVGLLVTALNLIPVGQLDGGHIAYALLGPKSAKLAPLILIGLVAMGLFFWVGWLLWAAIAALFMFLPRFRHPRVFDEGRPLSRGRVILGFAVVIVFILSFIPDPIRGYDLLGLLKLTGLGVK